MNAATLPNNPIRTITPQTNSTAPAAPIIELNGTFWPPNHPNNFCAPCIVNMNPTTTRKMAKISG
jgi:hypothetical protein